MILSDLSDVVSFLCLTNITVEQVLNWIYMIVFIASLLLGIILKVLGYFQDKKITKDELEDLQKSLEDAQKQIKEYEKHEKSKGDE